MPLSIPAHKQGSSKPTGMPAREVSRYETFLYNDRTQAALSDLLTRLGNSNESPRKLIAATCAEWDMDYTRLSLAYETLCEQTNQQH